MQHLVRALHFLTADDEDYRMDHQSPGKDDAPLHDLVSGGTYPEDIYSNNAVRYYGAATPGMDGESIAIIHSAKGKPNMRVKIYRAVPKIDTVADQIKELEKQMAYIQKRGKVPSYVDTDMDRSDYYEKISNELEELEAKPQEAVKKITINPGDWVTINKAYAVQHGKYFDKAKILTKTVKAKEVFTNGDSIHEWGYHP